MIITTNYYHYLDNQMNLVNISIYFVTNQLVYFNLKPYQIFSKRIQKLKSTRKQLVAQWATTARSHPEENRDVL